VTVSPKLTAGAYAGVGGVLGLFAGILAGNLLSKGRGTGAKAYVPALAGTALGAFAGAALGTADPSPPGKTAGTGRLPLGMGYAASEGTKAIARIGVAAEPSRYDGRYEKAGVEPPHKCTAKSALAIAQQLPGAPWVHEQSLPKTASIPWPTVEREYDVTTTMGSKRIPVWLGNGRLVLRCPYTGSWFVFRPGAS
jgi:hypothetical protein